RRARARVPPTGAGPARADRPALLPRPASPGDGRRPWSPTRNGQVASAPHGAGAAGRSGSRRPRGAAVGGTPAMTTEHDFPLDRELTRWLESVPPTRAPDDLLDGALARTARTRQRPGWLVPERWTLMQSTLRLVRVPRPALLLLLVALVLVA